MYMHLEIVEMTRRDTTKTYANPRAISPQPLSTNAEHACAVYIRMYTFVSTCALQGRHIKCLGGSMYVHRGTWHVIAGLSKP